MWHFVVWRLSDIDTPDSLRIEIDELLPAIYRWVHFCVVPETRLMPVLCTNDFVSVCYTV